MGLPARTRSTSNQDTSAAPEATTVFVNASAATPSAANSEPALKPNQPNHSSVAPSATNGTLCGRWLTMPKPLRLPAIRQRTRPVRPDEMCTTSPPAKSSAPIKSPTRLPSPPHTMCARGGYTSTVHATRNAHTAPNFMRPATAPVIMAVVIMQNAIWNTTSIIAGYASWLSAAGVSPVMLPTSPASPSWSNPPKKGTDPSPP